MNAFVEVHPEVMLGRPEVRLMRITVENILERLGVGETVKHILEPYPQLPRKLFRVRSLSPPRCLRGTRCIVFLTKLLEVPV